MQQWWEKRIVDEPKQFFYNNHICLFVNKIQHLVVQVNRILDNFLGSGFEMGVCFDDSCKVGKNRVDNILTIYCINDKMYRSDLLFLYSNLRRLIISTFIEVVEMLFKNRYEWFDKSDHLDKTIDDLILISKKLVSKNVLHFDTEPNTFCRLHVSCADGFIMEGKSDFVNDNDKSTRTSELDAFYRTFLKGHFSTKDGIEKQRIPVEFYRSFADLGYIATILSKLYSDEGNKHSQNIYFDRSFLSHDTFEIHNVDHRTFWFNLINLFSEETIIDIFIFNHLFEKDIEGNELASLNVPWPFYEKRVMETDIYKSRQILQTACFDFYNKYLRIAKDFYISIII